MRKTRDGQNRRLFEWGEWLTKNQVQGYYPSQSMRGIISWVFLMFHCLKKSCAFLKHNLNQETGKKTWLSNWCPLYKSVNAIMECNTRASVGMTVSIEPWQTNDRAFRVNLLKSNVHRLYVPWCTVLYRWVKELKALTCKQTHESHFKIGACYFFSHAFNFKTKKIISLL